MRINQIVILHEGYKEATTEFNTATGNPDAVNKIITAYRDLVNRNQVSGNERNIDWWRKQGWEKFSAFVVAKSREKSTTQVKRNKVPGRAITLHEDDEWLIVVPIDKDASCYHGKNTDWCTTKSNHGHFEQYFYSSGVTLIYFLNKRNGGKWAIAIHDDGKREFFDQDDESLTGPEFRRLIGMDPQPYITMAMTTHQDEIQSARDLYYDVMHDLKELIQSPSIMANVGKIEQMLLYTKDYNLLRSYAQKTGSIVDPKLQLAAVNFDGELIRYVKNPSVKLQLTAIGEKSTNINYIRDPDENIQLTAVKTNPAALIYIKHPTETVMRTAVDLDGDVIFHIKNPSEDLQILAVSRSSDAINYIQNPSETVRIAAVTNDGNAIQYIKNPSEEVQIAAIRSKLDALQYIKNPTQRVEAIWNKLQWQKLHDEATQNRK